MTFKTNNNEFLAVPAPVDASDFQVTDFREHPSLYFKADFGTFPGVGRYTDLPPGDWDICGLFYPREKRLDFEVDEEWVSSIDFDGWVIYKDYSNNRGLDTAQDSFIALLLSELKKEFPLEVNPHGNKEQYLVTACEPGDLSHLLQEWRLAQSQVLPDRVLILRLIASGGTRVSVSAVGDK